MHQACNFTKKSLDQLQPGSRSYRVHDKGGPQSVPGLCIFVRPSGVKSFAFYRKFQGKPVMVTLGRYPSITINIARTLAFKARSMMAHGINPNERKRRDSERGITFGLAFESYVKGKDLAANTEKGYRAAIDQHLEDWKARELISISDSDVKNRYAKIATSSIESANKAMRVVRAVHRQAFKKSQDENGNLIRIANPVDVLGEDNLWRKSDPRKNRLKTTQFKPWFDALEHINPIHADYLKFILLTGVRRREASCLRVSDFDINAGTVKVYASKVKSTYTVHLSDYLLGLMKRRVCESDKWIFPSPYSESGHLEEPKSVVSRIEKLSGVRVSVHDLRRTFISIASSELVNIPPAGVKRLVNHAVPKDITEKHYIQFEDDQLQRYTQAITDAVLKMAKRDSNSTDFFPSKITITRD